MRQVIKDRLHRFERRHQLSRLLQIVLLVIILGRIKTLVGQDFHDGLLLQAFLDALSGFLSLAFLLVVVVKDNIGILAASRLMSGVYSSPEDLQQTLVRNHQRIELYFRRLRMTVEVVISGVDRASVGIADLC